MPPTAVQSNNGSTRRSTNSLRQRENRAQPQHHQSTSSIARRRRSRSPDARGVDDSPVQNENLTRRKKRPVTIAGTLPSSSNTHTNAGGLSRSSGHEDPGDRGRSKSKPKTRSLLTWVGDDDDNTQFVTNIVQDHGRPVNAPGTRSKRSRSRETTHRASRKTTTPEPTEGDDEPMYTGPLAHAEYVRMKQELESLRKQVTLGKKTINKQSKVIDELRAELTMTTESQRTQRAEMEEIKTRSKKSDDLIATMEGSLTCQICMEVLLKPYGLSPCGHVLCMGCLLEWFKAAPPRENEMDDDNYPDALLYRRKTCPCCRTIVRTRPIPLYLVKSLVSALEKSKAPGTMRPSPPPEEQDPWAGIFRDPMDPEGYWSSDEEEDEDEDDEDDEDDGEDDEQYDDEDDYWSFDGYGTAEEDDQYDGPYVNPRWAPPNVYVSPDRYPYLDAYAPEMAILRRGGTLEMMELFQMTYDHDNGLCALIDGEHEVYLGWNIALHPEDETGEEYIDWVVQDMWHRPERWRVVNDAETGSWKAWKLIPEGDDDDFENTDTEDYLDDMDEDEDM